MKTIVCYVSGHGFGHAVRVIEVLRALRALAPDLRFAIRTPIPRSFFDLQLDGPFEHASRLLDVGVVQSDSLSVDPDATLERYARLIDDREAIVERERRDLGALRPSLIFADIPALAFDLAERLSVPSVAMANFSWDWIYEDYVRERPAHAAVVEDLRRSYGRATLLLRLPMHGDLSAFPRMRDVPLVARRASRAAGDVRRRLDLPAGERIVLLSFGGIGLELERLPASSGVRFVDAYDRDGLRHPGYRSFSQNLLSERDVRYEDLLAASDAVVGKPGYGLVAECIANGTPLIYTSRGRFAEYPILVDAVRAHLPNAFIGNDDLRAGRWGAALEAVLAAPRRRPEVDVGGAAVAARAILELAR